MWSSIVRNRRLILVSKRIYPQACGHVLRGLSTRINPSSSQFPLADDDLTSEAKEELEKQLRKEEIREALSKKKGRGWTDPWDMEDILSSKTQLDDLPDWSPKHVSRISKKRVQIYKERIPKLDVLAELALPPPPPPHPGLGHAKAYALYRKRSQYAYVLDKVKAMAKPKIGAIQALTDWEEKQDAVDELFEEIEFALKEREEILGKHPKFGSLVERALEEYLRTAQTGKDASTEKEDKDASAVPIFIDTFNSKIDSAEKVIPKILEPLKVNEKEPTRGRMIEEWEVSAHKESKRIMIRQCTRQIARALCEDQPQRILVTGRQGAGKTAALAAIVASARKSGYIVLYMPDGDRMRKNGFYVEPNEKRPGVFDLPILSQEVCQNLLNSHEDDLQGLKADSKTIGKFFTAEQAAKLGDSKDSMSVVDLLKHGVEKSAFSPMCYAASVEVLMNQTDKPFLIVGDEFNCLFDESNYFHAAYDEDVNKPVPLKQISLFQPLMEAMAVSADEEVTTDAVPRLMKRGGIVVGTTESHAVPRRITESLTANAKLQENVTVCDVPRLSALEVDHMLANYECIGVGKLRLDRGETVMNSQEVAYLRTVSGGIAQKLMDASMM